MNERQQPFILNPEWEANKEQNIAIAKRIDKLLMESPDAVSDIRASTRNMIEELEELQAAEGIKDLEEHGWTREDIPDYLKDILAIEELTVGHTTVLSNINNKSRRIFLGVGYSEQSLQQGEVGAFIGDLLPKGFNLPVYIITGSTDVDDDITDFYASTIYGKMPNRVISADGMPCALRNVYCVNIYGQGLKTEEIIRESWFNESERIGEEHKLPRLNFIPKPEHSRVVPLAPEDYETINKMFEDIDAGLYKTPQV